MKKSFYCIVTILISSVLIYCKTSKSGSQGSLSSKSEKRADLTQVDFSSSPVVPADEAISKMVVEEGFEVRLVASEPLISTPVALAFDKKDRIWVVEMTNYMPDTLGLGEDIPNGKVIILEDKNKDGVADERKVFLDSLLMPRAICFVGNGILVAEPPNLWYYEIIDDKPANRVLVDGKYAEGGNVEHQPNGLLRTLDNWIYSAKSDKRYRKKGNKWVIERTHFRGQWGISQDNYGRLYYNSHSQNLSGDYFSPGLGAGNKNQHSVAGFNEKIVIDNRVYPARPNSVNRGYMSGTLDSASRLVNFTAACGPAIYRGDLFGPQYANNAFVAEPSANLIKRNVLQEKGYVISGNQAYNRKEFLASVDERFRPVNLYNSPDGSLYVVDMYRGILEHATYMTPYLKTAIRTRGLSQPMSCGRIYKIVPKNKAVKKVIMPENRAQLVKLLGHSNGWIRDNAQQSLVDGNSTRSIPALRQAMKKTSNNLLVIHALWTLEGLHALRAEDIISLLKDPAWPLRMQALSVLPSVINKKTYEQYSHVLEQLITQNDTLAIPYLAFLSGSVRSFDKIAANNMLKKIVSQYPDNRYLASAAVSTLQDNEELFLKEVKAFVPNRDLAVVAELQRVIKGIKDAQTNQNQKSVEQAFAKGASMFKASCQTCHGQDGNGIKYLAPPLNRSEWVTGSKEKLISIVLFGLTGPVKVNNHVYQAPEINGDMPGIGFNSDLGNSDIASLLSYIRNSWSNKGGEIDVNDVIKVRQKLKDRQKAFTVEELDKM